MARKAKRCEHTLTDDHQIEFDGEGIYVRYKCGCCKNNIIDYYELVNRFNDTTGKEEKTRRK